MYDVFSIALCRDSFSLLCMELGVISRNHFKTYTSTRCSKIKEYPAGATVAYATLVAEYMKAFKFGMQSTDLISSLKTFLDHLSV